MHLRLCEYHGYLNNTAINTGVYVSFQISVFVFFRYIPRDRIVESYTGSIFNFLQNHHTVFHSGCTNLYFHQQCTSVSFPPPPHHICHLVSFCWVILTGVRQCFTVGLVCISPWLVMLSLCSVFVCLFAICASSLEKCLFILLPMCWLGCLFCFWYWIV